MNDEKIRQGATFEVTLKDTDITAETATITVSNGGAILKSDTANYVETDGVMYATLRLDTTSIPLGTHEYMYTITYADDVVVKLPDASSCDEDECDLPAFIVCEANDIETS